MSSKRKLLYLLSKQFQYHFIPTDSVHFYVWIVFHGVKGGATWQGLPLAIYSTKDVKHVHVISQSHWFGLFCLNETPW